MKIFCIGRNYVDHIHELKNEMPESMVIFMKPESALHNLSQPWVVPCFSDDVHFECELILKINKEGKNIPIEISNEYFEEIGLGIDFTARDIQTQLKAKGLPWEKSKAFDGSAIAGGFIPKSEFDLEDLNFQLLKNDTIVQEGNTQQMIHSFSSIISELSNYFTLSPGDLIYTGTPAGVAATKAGDDFIGYIEQEEIFRFTAF